MYRLFVEIFVHCIVWKCYFNSELHRKTSTQVQTETQLEMCLFAKYLCIWAAANVCVGALNSVLSVKLNNIQLHHHAINNHYCRRCTEIPEIAWCHPDTRKTSFHFLFSKCTRVWLCSFYVYKVSIACLLSCTHFCN